MLIQIGNIDNHPTAENLMEVATAFIEEIMRKYKKNIKILDAVLHADEATPHIHLRFTICAEVNDVLMPSINKGLEQAGFDHVTHQQEAAENTRYNNRLIAFTDLLRERFIQLTKEHLNIDVIKGTPHKHADKGEYIRLRDAEFAAASAELAERQMEVARLELKNAEKERELDAREAKLQHLERVEEIYTEALEKERAELQHKRRHEHGRGRGYAMISFADFLALHIL